MVLKSVPFALAVALVLAWGGIARADDYKPDEYLGLDLSKAVLSPKRLGPETQFEPVPIEAKDGAQANADESARPRRPRKTHVAKPRIENTHVERTRSEPPRAVAHVNARTKLAHRHGSPLDAQARDTRIQTWPCRSGGICSWRR